MEHEYQQRLTAGNEQQTERTAAERLRDKLRQGLARLIDSYTEGYNMIKMLPDIIKAGAGWQPKAAEVPAVLVTKDTVEQFVKEHPDAIK